MEVAWTTREHSVRQRTSIHGRVDKKVEQNVGNKDEAVNSILSTDRWVDGMNEPKIGTISLVLCGIQTKRLARMVGISQICSE